ncbi:hypothetical protein SLS58_005044 [Diplodia intermedia]|uniref:F-box domain-containing protein n=1 Tax=Diplodia intermedia TaxID=856260 RepID=A0ABR3TSB6_9PEZI
MDTSVSRLHTLPADIVTAIADFLDVTDCGSLRMTSKELHAKSTFSFVKHVADLGFSFHPLRLAELCIVSQSPAIAEAIQNLAIYEPDDNHYDNPCPCYR